MRQRPEVVRVHEVVGDGPGLRVGHVLELVGRADVAESPHAGRARAAHLVDDDPAHAWRAQIFLNGWNLGQYVNDVGPQHTFVLPNGILRTRGDNTLALAVLSDGTTPSGPRDARLTLLRSAAGGVPVAVVDSPGR